MIQIDSRGNQLLAVFGLGASGFAAAQALAASGADVLAWDDNEDQRRHAENNGVPLHDLYHADFADDDEHQLVLGARARHPADPPAAGRRSIEGERGRRRIVRRRRGSVTRRLPLDLSHAANHPGAA